MIKTWKGPGRARSLSAGQWAWILICYQFFTGRQIDSWPCQVPFMLHSVFASKFDTYHLKYWLYYTHWVRASKSDTSTKLPPKKQTLLCTVVCISLETCSIASQPSVAVGWVKIKVWSMAQLKGLTAKFKLISWNFQKSQGY